MAIWSINSKESLESIRLNDDTDLNRWVSAWCSSMAWPTVSQQGVFFCSGGL